MQNVTVDHTRNFAIIGHAGDGKTSLGEAILHRAGATAELGKVDDGSSVLNYMPEERDGHHTASITSHVYAFDWHGHHLTMVDTPGDPNFAGDGEVAIQALDAVILVVDGVEGVKSGTQRMLNTAREYALPVLAFVNGLDRERADLDRAVASLKELDTRPVLLDTPIGGDSPVGVLDVLHGKVISADGTESEIPPELQDEYQARREALVEAVAESDDELIEKYLETGELSEEEVREALAVGTRTGALLPVLCGSAIGEVGVDVVLQEVTELLPSPEDRGSWEARAVDDDHEMAVEPKEDAEFAAVIFKTVIDRYAGALSVLRIVSGTLEHDSGVLNASNSRKTRVGKMFLLRGEEHVDVDSAGPGDIVAVAKLKDVHTGDVLTCEKDGVHLPEPKKPEGVISYAVEAEDKKDEEKLFTALGRLADEDPSLHIGREPTTGQYLVTGMGELHIRTTAHKLERMFNIKMKLSTPKVPYRETITRRVENVEGKLKKQTGGSGMFGVCYINMEPLSTGEGVQFDDKIVGGAIPRNLIPAVEKGIMEGCVAGPLAGYPVVDLKVECIDGKYHSVDSNEMAFKLAGRSALRNAMEKAGAVLLEPYMDVEIVAPDEAMGDVMGDIASRRGVVQTTEVLGHSAVVKATVPMSEMLEYAPTLSSITGGKGEFHMSFSHYERLNGKLAEKVVEEAKAEAAEA
ncbi:MAG: elongation factor G [Planctomycetota bacterium]